MAHTDSIFTIQIFVEELKSHIIAKSVRIVARFGDVFKIDLKNPNKLLVKALLSRRCKKQKHKKREPSGQTVKIASDIDSLVKNMLMYPLEITILSKDPYSLGIVEIPWNLTYVDYLKNLHPNDDTIFTIREAHRVYDDYTSKRIADLKLVIKINQVQEDTCVQTQTIGENLQSTGTMNPGTKKVLNNGREHTNNISVFDAQPFVQLGESIVIRDIVPSQESEKDVYNLFHCKESNVSVSEKSERNISKTSRSSILSLVRSQTDIQKSTRFSSKRWSGTSIEIKKHLDTLNYAFGRFNSIFGNQEYFVGYCTVKNDSPKSKSIPASGTSSPVTTNSPTYTSRPTVSSTPTAISAVECSGSLRDQVPTKNGPATLIQIKQPSDKITEVVGAMLGKMQIDQENCFCTCECTFGFVKKTTYCEICGGYEKPGEKLVSKRGENLPPFPCPIYHNLAEVGKKTPAKTPILDTLETTISKDKEVRRSNASPFDKLMKGQPRGRVEKKEKYKTEKRSSERPSEKKSDSEKDSKKAKKKKKNAEDERFKFDYGFVGIPASIGHDYCAKISKFNVPKWMGWLWNARDVPGLKHRPDWRPGAANKHIVRMLRRARNPEQEMSRKKRLGGNKKNKRPIKRPLLTVHKFDGEYTVTLETMKQYSKPRAISQAPYEEKPVVTYTIGRTELENLERKKKKDRAARRLEREQRAFVQSTFRNMCKDICQKTYDQALGLMPFAEDPLCPCYPVEPDYTRINLSESCSCTESTRSSASATDDDEWLVEITPPIAYCDPNWKGKRIYHVDCGTQYTYLDYRVKILDKQGNQIPRFFTGPDGKEQCSDLGGFWDPDHHWLEINMDGQIAPDGRWAPISFYLPTGENVDTIDGKFETPNGAVMVVGVDGYVDAKGVWREYANRKKKNKVTVEKKSVAPKVSPTEKTKVKVRIQKQNKKSETTFSCFGDTSPRTLSHMGILGHGQDRRLLLSTLEKLVKDGEQIHIPTEQKKPIVLRKKGKSATTHARFLQDHKCVHATPSSKGILIDEQGRKRYFTPSDYKNPRPKNRLTTLGKTGISVSSFHVPCYDSFISCEALRHQQYDHIKQHNVRVMENRS